MDQIGAPEARRHLLRLLARAARGGSLAITRNGEPVARLLPVIAQGIVVWSLRGLLIVEPPADY